MNKKQTQSRNKTRATGIKARARHHARTVLVPHKGNNYRPHLIRVHGLVAVLVIALLAQVVYGYLATGTFQVLGRASDISAAELLEDTNQQRTAAGLEALQPNTELAQAAALKAQDMFAHNYWAHTSPQGVEPWKWFGDVGYSYSVAGENLAKNYPSAQATVTAWMNSETHRANIMNGKYVDVGFAVADGTIDGSETTLVVALYGAPAVLAATDGEPTQAVFTAAKLAGPATNPLGYFASALQSLSPVTVAVLGLFGLVAIVGVAAHHYRNKLPKSWRKSWKVHHGMYTFVGMIALGALVVLATGGGSL